MAGQRFASDSANAEALLDLLAEIEQGEAATQRSLAHRLGIALGLTNSYLRRCARKGWVKVRAVPTRRYGYYLTPQGFAEKCRLTNEYLRCSFSFFRRAREECAVALQNCANRGQMKVLLYGEGELAEIATLAALDAGVELVGVVAPGSNRPDIAGLPVHNGLADTPAFDAVLLTESREPQPAYDTLSAHVDDSLVRVLPLSKVHRATKAFLRDAEE